MKKSDTKIILKLYPTRKRTSESIGSKEAFEQDCSYFKRLSNELYANKSDMYLQFGNYRIYYRDNIEEYPHKIQGFRADVVEIFNNCVSDEILHSVIAPMQAEVISIDKEYLK